MECLVSNHQLNLLYSLMIYQFIRSDGCFFFATTYSIDVYTVLDLYI